jgi:hypothetical protein
MYFLLQCLMSALRLPVSLFHSDWCKDASGIQGDTSLSPPLWRPPSTCYFIIDAQIHYFIKELQGKSFSCFFFFFFFAVPEFVSGPHACFSRCSTTWDTPPALIALIIFEIVYHFMPGQHGPWSSYLHFHHSWNDKHTRPQPVFYWLKWGLANFLSGLA